VSGEAGNFSGSTGTTTVAKVAAIVAAAGSGDRLGGGQPKALVELAGRPLVAWSVAALAASERVEQLVIAAPGGHEDQIAAVAGEAAPNLPLDVVAGGSSRSRSVANGLEAVPEAAIIVVHDAARPLVTAELIDRSVSQLERWGCDAVIAAARATDTIKEANAGGRVTATLERSSLWAVQTPQTFRADALRKAADGSELDRAYDDAQLVEAIGGDVRVVESSRDNLKITTPFDLRVAELVLEGRKQC
jgi:2-C-methyl-D-erythritol 4-phosphate cytidylyltransferase